ncbi:MAG: hypothetical protein R3C68_01325 [Myxococcota bacterium]
MIALPLAACASNPRFLAQKPRPMVASLNAVGSISKPDVPDNTTPTVLPHNAGAGQYLEQGLMLFRHMPLTSTPPMHLLRLLKPDSSSTMLGVPWHTGMPSFRRHIGQIDASTNALASFAALADDIIDERRHVQYAVTDNGAFVERFMLKTNCEAQAILSVTWSQRVDSFGRSVSLPVPIRSQEKERLFLPQLVPLHRNRRSHGAASKTLPKRLRRPRTDYRTMQHEQHGLLLRC